MQGVGGARAGVTAGVFVSSYTAGSLGRSLLAEKQINKDVVLECYAYYWIRHDH